MDNEIISPLPSYFSIKANNTAKYLSYVNEQGEAHGHLKFFSDYMVTPFTKFAAELTEDEKGDFVHLKCLYNNKYLVQASSSSNYILAAADAPEEDQSKDTCTLFKPIHNSDTGYYRLRHVRLGLNVRRQADADPPFDNCLFAGSAEDEPDGSDYCIITDWDSRFALPRYLAFKGHNGSYLKPYDRSGTMYLQFSGSKIGDPGVINEVFMTSDGHVRIRNLYTDKFWCRDPNWILSDSSGSDPDDSNALFMPVKLQGNMVAFRCKANDCFITALSVDGKENCLNSSDGKIVDRAKIEMIEPVVTREIYNVNFRLKDARFYGQKPKVMDSGTVTNKNSADDKLGIKLNIEDTTTSTWSSSTSTKTTIEMTIETGIPKVVEAELTLSAEMSEEYKWGETIRIKNVIEATHELVVLPSTTVKSSVMATEGVCDVPFSYSQRDTLSNGETVIHHFEDGIYTGISSYNFTFVSEEV